MAAIELLRIDLAFKRDECLATHSLSETFKIKESEK